MTVPMEEEIIFLFDQGNSLVVTKVRGEFSPPLSEKKKTTMNLQDRQRITQFVFQKQEPTYRGEIGYPN